MVDRYRVWLGAGVLAGGMSAAMLAGAGVAAADDGEALSAESQAAPGSDDEEVSSKATTDEEGTPDGAEPDPGVEERDLDGAEQDLEDSDGSNDGDAGGKKPSRTDPAGENSQIEAVGRDADEADDAGDAGDAEVAPEPEYADEVPRQQPEEPALPGTDHETEDVLSDDSASAEDHGGLPSPLLTSLETDLASREGAAVMQTAAAQSPGIVTGLLNLLDTLNEVGTAFYNLYTGTMQFLAGPARAPFGSRVRVESSPLTIGDGFGDDIVVPADWYFPPGDTELKGLIYLQHGMLATSAFYGATAAYLAEKTHSIVVAPTLTWNIFDFENLPLMLSHTHKAIADLFVGDRAALTASARTAGYTTALPGKVVLAGHSAGGGLVVGTARYMVERGLGSDLAGVLMLDGAGFVSLGTDLAKIPRSIPVYNLAADPDTWNNFGDATRRLRQARPDAFTGIAIVGGRHSDSMQSSSMLVQLAAYFATGFSSPFHIAINQMLASAWISDMLDGAHTPERHGSFGSAANIAAGTLTGAARGGAITSASTSKHAADVCEDGRLGLTCSST